MWTCQWDCIRWRGAWWDSHQLCCRWSAAKTRTTLDFSNYGSCSSGHGVTCRLAYQGMCTYVVGEVYCVIWQLFDVLLCQLLTYFLQGASSVTFDSWYFSSPTLLTLFRSSSTPIFLPLHNSSLHLSSSTTAGLDAAFKFPSAVGRLCYGLLSDYTRTA